MIVEILHEVGMGGVQKRRVTMQSRQSGHAAQSVPEQAAPCTYWQRITPSRHKRLGNTGSRHPSRPGDRPARVLGSGKTTFVQGLARGLGVRSRVSSPLLCWSMNTLALMARAWRT